MTVSTHSAVRAVCWLLALSIHSSASLAQQLDLDALYAKAAAEGEVSAYLQGPPQVYAAIVREGLSRNGQPACVRLATPRDKDTGA